MSRNELIAKIAEAQAEAEAIKDSIKAEMLEQQTRNLKQELTSSVGRPSSQTALTAPPLKENTANCTSDLPNRFQAAGFPLYKKSPLPTSRPKQQAKS